MSLFGRLSTISQTALSLCISSLLFPYSKKIGAMNDALQEQYTLLPEAWASIILLKRSFCDSLRRMRNGDFGDFDFTDWVSQDEKDSFIVIIERLIFNIDVRFPCPSTSIISRQARHNIDYQRCTMDRGFLHNIRTHCPLFLTVGIYLFPDEFIKERKVNEFFLSGNFPEILRIMTYIVNHQEAIMDCCVSIDNGTGSAVMKRKTVTLFEVFKIVNRTNYPFLWDITLKAITILPTTVSCEQQFSRLRHKLHENMRKETSFAFLSMSQKRKDFSF